MSGHIVSTHSIRCRILKDLRFASLRFAHPSFNPFDPMQDTERNELRHGV